MLWRGVCPRDIAMIAIAALDCALRRPRRLQPTTLPVAALWMAAPYHAVTKAARRRNFLSNSLPSLARRPLLPPVTTPFPHSAPHRRSGSDRHARRAAPEPSPAEQRAQAHRADRSLRTGPRGSQGSTPSAPSAGGAAGAAMHTRGFRSGPCEADRMGGAWHRCTRKRSFVPPVSIEPGVFGRLGGAQSAHSLARKARVASRAGFEPRRGSPHPLEHSTGSGPRPGRPSRREAPRGGGVVSTLNSFSAP